MVQKQSFGPEWLVMLVRVEARQGNLPAAERVAATMPKLVGNAVVASASNRNTGRDQGALELAQAEIELARHRPEKALALVEDAVPRLEHDETLEPLAFASAMDGRSAEASARYTELIEIADFNRETQEEWFAAHLALGRLDEQAGRTEDARRLYERVAALWKDGDPDLLLLRQIRARLRAVTR